MALEFDLRPRIRLRDDFAAPRQRPRFRLPKYALPVTAYWLVVAGMVYALTRAQAAAPAETATGMTGTAVATAEAEPQAERRAALDQPGTPPPRPATPPTGQRDVPNESQAPSPSAAPVAPEPAAGTPQHDAVPPTAFNALSSLDDDRDDPARPHATSSPTRAAQDARDTSHAVAGSLPSCEAISAIANQNLDFASADHSADLPSRAIAGVLENGAWLGACDVPAGTSLEVCVAIQGGDVIGASVVARPANPPVAACVKGRAALLQFPYNPHTDLARTRF
jgi:hypothetical protein